ncbi:MAG: NADH-quinone oxidoreductase subunit J [Pseudomonadales bacterium]|nr:NADH-quinone oxidoreductase subunit J [Pseudomonadales bacterium]
MALSDWLAPDMAWAAFSVIVPLAAALLSLPLARHARYIALPAALLGLIVACASAAQVWLHGAVLLAAGGWAPPLGIVLRLDGLAAAFLVLTAAISTAVAWYALPQFAARGASESRSGFAFWPLLFFLWAGLNALLVSNDLFNLYVALELIGLTAVALVALDGKPAVIAAALRYLLFALFGSLAYLLGVVLLYAQYATLDMTLLRHVAQADFATLLAAALMTAGLLAKTALVPLHAWLPPAHAGAPAPASALLSALVVKGSFYVVIRLWFDVLPNQAGAAFTTLLGTLGALAILYGSALAFRQNRLKPIIAYSTVAQLGYLFLVFPLAGGAGEAQPWGAAAWSGGMFHALSHGLAKAAMFLAAGTLIQAVGHDRIDGLDGIARSMPIAAFAFGLAAISLMGLPPSGGFTAKYLLLTAALAAGQWGWAIIMIVGGLLAAGYLFRVLNRFLLEGDRSATLQAVPAGGQIIALLLALAAILLGLLSATPYALLQIGRPDAAAGGLS